MPPKAGKKSNNNVKHEPVDLPQATSIKPVDTPDDTFPKPVDPPDDTFPKPVDPPHDTSPGPPSLFWNIVANRQQAASTGGEHITGHAGWSSNNGSVPHNAPALAAGATATAKPTTTNQRAPSTYTTASNATWEDAGQYALNASILSGMFEDLRIVTFSRRSSNDSITTPRVLYANQTLLTRTIPALLTVEVADQKLEEKATFLENAVVPAVSYGYGEDSDLEDYQSDEEESEDDGTTKTPNVHLDAETEGQTPASLVAGSDPSQPDTSSPTHSLSEDDENSRTEGADSKESNAAASIPRGAPSPTESESFVSVSPPENATAPPSANHGPQASDVKPKKPRVKTQTASKSRPMVDPAVTRPRSIVVTDIAYRTWRAVLFYAYTHRIAFSPLRSQGVNLAPVDDENDPAQLPICSPKSVYRLAVKYGHTELQQLAMSDIWSKLSTQNVLTELFSSFTSRYPAIQEMELNYVGVYIKHPDIIVRLPAWTDRFARGELKEHADTFGRFIHMLVCAATAAPAGGNMCPRGCAMATVQHRCTMCGITFM